MNTFSFRSVLLILGLLCFCPLAHAQSPLDNKLSARDQSNVVHHLLKLAQRGGGRILTDCDGTVFNNGHPLPGAVSFLQRFSNLPATKLRVVTGRTPGAKIKEAQKWFDQWGIKMELRPNEGDPRNAIAHKCTKLRHAARRGPVIAFLENDPDAVRQLARTAIKAAKNDPVSARNLKNFYVIMVGETSSQHWDAETWAKDNVNNPNWSLMGAAGDLTTAGSILRLKDFSAD